MRMADEMTMCEFCLREIELHEAWEHRCDGV